MDIDLDSLDINNDKLWDLIDSLDTSVSTVSTVSSSERSINCLECDENNFESDITNGIVICTNCGFIKSEILEKSINNLNNSKSINRFGCPTNFFLPKSSLGTKVKNGRFSTLSLLEKWSQMPYKERSLLDVLKFMEACCLKYKVPKTIIENGKILFKRINDSKHTSGINQGKNIIIRGLNRKSLIAACIFHGAIKQNIPYSPKEISKIFSIQEKYVTKGCRKLRDLLPLDNILCEIKSCESYEYICRKDLLKIFNIDNRFLKIIKKLSLNITKLGLVSDHQPPSVAAGIILLISKIFSLNITKKKISDIFMISHVTIMKTYKKLNKYKKFILSDKNTNNLIKIVTVEYTKMIDTETDSETLENSQTLENSEEIETYSNNNQRNLIKKYLN